MEVVYKKNGNAIICGDCVEVMAKFPNNSIDLIVTSPPYWDKINYKTGCDKELGIGSLEDYLDSIYVIGKECFRVLKDDSCMVWIIKPIKRNGEIYHLGSKISERFVDLGFSHFDFKIILLLSLAHYDFCYFFSKGKVSRASKGVLFQPVWDTRKDNEKMGKEGKLYHPASFKRCIPKEIILLYSSERSVVLDPMAGSGTTLIEAMENNRKFIGIDISREYCEIARDRILKCDNGSSV